MIKNGFDPIEIKNNPIDIDFHLSSYFDPYLRNLITSLPKKEKLQDLEALSPFFQIEIKKCLEYAYSYVAQRNYVEGTPTFFAHVAGTVCWEAASNELIKGKDHAQKAATIVFMINNILKDINIRKQNPILKPKQIEIITSFEKLLESHVISLQTALQCLSLEKQDLLCELQKYNVKNNQPNPLTPEKIKAINQFHPRSSQNVTPKKLTDPDKDSLNYLVPPEKRAQNVDNAKKFNEKKQVKRNLFADADLEEKKFIKDITNTIELNQLFNSDTKEAETESPFYDFDDSDFNSENSSDKDDDFYDPLTIKMNTLVFSSPFSSPKKNSKINSDKENYSKNKQKPN